MSSDNEGRVHAVDEENYVDKERKRQILNSRLEAREWRRELFTNVRTGDMDEQVAVLLWGDRVREYLMSIEPLLRNFSLPNAEELYKERELGQVQVYPPDELRNAAQGRRGESTSGLTVLNGDLEPRTHTIHGLKEVIDREYVEFSWSVQIRDPSRNPPRQSITETNSEALPRHILRKSVRDADEWLQNVGIGVETGTPEIDDRDENPF